ncbi:MAG: aspartate 1-decarboxylase [Candidatus Dormibacteraceae bacterium]
MRNSSTSSPSSEIRAMGTRTLLRSKLHRATVTGADLNYEGSLSICPTLMKLADICPNELVHVANINTGERFITYAILGESGECRLNGAAARLGQGGDKVIIMTYSEVPNEVAQQWEPMVVLVDDENRVEPHPAEKLPL